MSSRLKGILKQLQESHGPDRLEPITAALHEIGALLDKLDGEIQALEKVKGKVKPEAGG